MEKITNDNFKRKELNNYLLMLLNINYYIHLLVYASNQQINGELKYYLLKINFLK